MARRVLMPELEVSMMTLKEKLSGIALTILVGGTAYAQTAPANDPAPDQAPSQTAQASNDDSSETVSCPSKPTANAPAGCPQPAQAQPAPQPAYEPEGEAAGTSWVKDVGVALSVGGGVDDFAGSMHNTTNIGGSWDARLTFGTRQYLAGEVSYIGSAQTYNTIADNHGTLTGNGAQAVLRLNATVDYPIQPFIYGGAAWRHYDLTTSTAALADVATSADVLEVPAGGGIAAYFDQLVLDVRGEYRFAWGGSDIANGSTNNGTGALSRWGVSGNIGYVF
ncbi:MAG TPA: hypothetical protein VMJ10_16800 [Kofleriaceae bacterium]|nr:hypothetical protein [Kofleriaceae bacterium]